MNLEERIREILGETTVDVKQSYVKGFDDDYNPAYIMLLMECDVLLAMDKIIQAIKDAGYKSPEEVRALIQINRLPHVAHDLCEWLEEGK